MSIKSIIRGALLLAVAVTIAGCGQSGGGDAAFKPYSTCAMMFNVASSGCEGYKNAHGSWPNSLQDINAMMTDLVHKDAWLHDLAFTPYDPAKGYGEITSYGRDGKPGGSGEDADIVLHFPLKANADWNRQQAMNIKIPPQAKKDWFEFYLQ